MFRYSNRNDSGRPGRVDGGIFAAQRQHLLVGLVAVLCQQLPALGRRYHLDSSYRPGWVSYNGRKTANFILDTVDTGEQKRNAKNESGHMLCRVLPRLMQEIFNMKFIN